jgi:thiamine-monophosphate kinase
VGAILDERFIPVHDDATLDRALYEGEDYELVFTMPPDAALDVKSEVEDKLNLPISIIGEIVSKEQGITIFHPDGSTEPLTKFGYNHFIK